MRRICGFTSHIFTAGGERADNKILLLYKNVRPKKERKKKEKDVTTPRLNIVRGASRVCLLCTIARSQRALSPCEIAQIQYQVCSVLVTEHKCFLLA